jgi:hypothetical protein
VNCKSGTSAAKSRADFAERLSWLPSAREILRCAQDDVQKDFFSNLLGQSRRLRD